ncbi:Glycosyltransferase, DXD sugar-binding motif [Kalmanozyma brasiliensis GHG001]|uniref:Glycosyltransferase n=1 Tax=Kalmanozyma brasiliensis (strain GHG001) TaxID=1365824 RepID=V5EW01_KALBG|nr:Glycosyltransferase, DXD sugar-binding motif [Kalmanozyma brasiliensis GHG001]EST07473.1 Glycosyltransferase, DXD sugar-binding motif [Kalmanozyma brasiliensis GHG001]
MASLLSRRASHILLILLGLFLAGTIVVLTTANAYFSIDTSAYVLPEELGTWEEIQSGASPDGPDGFLARFPWLHKVTHSAASKSMANASHPASNIDPNDMVARPQPWRDNTPKKWDPSNPTEKIPRIIHQTWKDAHLPARWQAIRDECAAMHPDYEYMLWTDDDSRKFIAEHYDWFLPVFDGYPYPIQRADAIRYFVLHHYGGIYMDLDIGCLRRFDPLLRFEVILPKTIPVGVSNDVMLSAKGHPFMDQLIHNLVNFNHQYLTNYPTVMFSTGPMFVSASYGLYVDVHGPAFPSTPKQPEAGFKGIRVLPKSLYGKNVKPIDAPDAFFSHFYGSSWHANDAGFLIFLRKYGRLLIFVGVCVVLYGLFRTLLPTFLFKFGGYRGGFGRGSTRAQRQTGRWISLPIGTSSISRRRSKRRSGSTADEDASVPLNSMGRHETIGSTSAANPSRLSMPAPRPTRLSLPLFQLQDSEPMSSDPAPQSVLAWMGQTLSRPSSRSDAISEMEANGRTESPSKKKGVLYLPAYFVRGDDGSSSSSQQLSPSSSASSQQLQGTGLSPLSHTSFAAASGLSLGQWASSLLPANWRGPSPAPSHGSRRSRLSQDHDLESLGSQQDEEEDEAGWDAGRKDAEHQPLMADGRSKLRSAWEAQQAAPPPYEDGSGQGSGEKSQA